jgi:hypothetical protein
VPSLGSFLRGGDGEGGDGLYTGLADAPSKGHAALAEILRAVAPSATVPDNVLFDEAGVSLLDTSAGVGLCDQLAAAEALGLVPRGTPAQKLARKFLDNLAP